MNKDPMFELELTGGVQGLQGEKGEKGEKGEQGLQGETGAIPNLQVGKVESIPITEDPEITITGDKENPVINFKIPGRKEVYYSDLTDLPEINGEKLIGSKSLEDLGIQPKGNYIENEEDPTVPEHVKNITEEDIEKWNQNSGGVGEETDPTVPEYVKSITEENISNWNNKSEFSGNYEDLNNKPTGISEFTNDADYITSEEASTKYQTKGNYVTSDTLENYSTKKENDNMYQPKGDYATKEEIPTKTSELDNDSNFLTEHQSLEDYVKSENVYDKDTIDTKLDDKVDKTEIKNFITENAADEKYATKGEIPSDYVTNHELEEHTTDDSKHVTAEDKLKWNGKQDAGDYVEKTEVYTRDEADSTFLKEHQSLEGYLKSADAEKEYAKQEDIPEPYNLPTATQDVLGGIKVGETLEMTPEGILNIKDKHQSIKIIDATKEEVDLDNYQELGQYIIIGNKIKQISFSSNETVSNFQMAILSVIEDTRQFRSGTYQIFETQTTIDFDEQNVVGAKYQTYRQLSPSFESKFKTNTSLIMSQSSKYWDSQTNGLMLASGVYSLYQELCTCLGIDVGSQWFSSVLREKIEEIFGPEEANYNILDAITKLNDDIKTTKTTIGNINTELSVLVEVSE